MKLWTAPTLLTLALGFQCLEASAYHIARVGGESTVYSELKTHVIVVGFADGSNDAFLQSALTRARKYRELYPSDQVILFGAREYENAPDLGSVQFKDVQHVLEVQQPLTGEELVKQVVQFEKIASFDYYGHATLGGGLQLENPSKGKILYLNARTPGVEGLKNRFTLDAYATLFGCNSGFIHAPALSKLWKIPVMGVLSSSDFQNLRGNGNWYFNNEGQFPKDLGLAKVNASSYKKPVPCADGACFRLMPENEPYASSKWGKFEAGLGFPKFFCNYTEVFRPSRCRENMARALMSLPSTKPIWQLSSRETFEEAVLDLLCPNASESTRRRQCIRALQDSLKTGNLVYSSFRGNSVECTFHKCRFNASWQSDREGRSVHQSFRLAAPENREPTTQIREYWEYLRGYDALYRKTDY